MTEVRDASDLTDGPSDPATSSPVTCGEFPHRMDPRFPSDLPSPEGGRERVLSPASQVAQALCGKVFEQFAASTGCPEQRPICAQERARSPHGFHRDRPVPVHNREPSARRLRHSRIGHRDELLAVGDSADVVQRHVRRHATSRGTDGLAASVRSPCSAAATALSSTRTSSLRSATACSASCARRYDEYANQASATARITAGRPSLNTMGEIGSRTRGRDFPKLVERLGRGT